MSFWIDTTVWGNPKKNPSDRRRRPTLIKEQGFSRAYRHASGNMVITTRVFGFTDRSKYNPQQCDAKVGYRQ